MDNAVFFRVHVLAQQQPKVLLPCYQLQLDVARSQYVPVMRPIVSLTLEGRKRHCLANYSMRLEALPPAQLDGVSGRLARLTLTAHELHHLCDILPAQVLEPVHHVRLHPFRAIKVQRGSLLFRLWDQKYRRTILN